MAAHALDPARLVVSLVDVMGHGTPAAIVASAVRTALQAQQLLADDWGVTASVWSATSWTELRRDAMAAEEWNLLHPEADQRVPYVTQALDGRPGPVVAVSDWIRAVPDQIARWVPASYTSLGTDGYGFSDTRAAARRLAPLRRRFLFRPARPRRAIPVRSRRTAARIN